MLNYMTKFSIQGWLSLLAEISAPGFNSELKYSFYIEARAEISVRLTELSSTPGLKNSM